MSKIIYFRSNGRFTNNLFQYFAAQIVKKILNYDFIALDTSNTELIKSSCYVIDDKKFKQIHTDTFLANIDTSKNIYLDGYFQRSEIFANYREYIKSLIHENNKDRFGILYSYTICDLVLPSKNSRSPGKNDLVMHIRLDDFLGDLQIFDSSFLKEIISKIQYDELYIVCDKLKQEWEYKYMAHFLDLQPILISESLLEDFNFMRQSTKILTSASTLSWMAAFLGEPEEVHIPYNTYHGGFEGDGQSLAGFDLPLNSSPDWKQVCCVYKNIKYYTKE